MKGFLERPMYQCATCGSVALLMGSPIKRGTKVLVKVACWTKGCRQFGKPAKVACVRH